MKSDLKSNFLPLSVGFFAGFAVFLAFFLFRGWLSSWHLKPDQGRIWEIILKAVGGLLALSGAIVAVRKYLDDKAAANIKYLDDKQALAKAEEKEATKGLLVMRQDIYSRLIKSMAKLINYDPIDQEWVPSKMQFFEIYWGELRWVWNTEVEMVADKYAAAVIGYKGGAKDDIINLSEDLVRACRKSLGEAWNFEKDLIPAVPFKSVTEHIKDLEDAVTPTS